MATVDIRSRAQHHAPKTDLAGTQKFCGTQILPWTWEQSRSWRRLEDANYDKVTVDFFPLTFIVLDYFLHHKQPVSLFDALLISDSKDKVIKVGRNCRERYDRKQPSMNFHI